MKNWVKRCVYIIDIVLGLALILAVFGPLGGCTAEQLDNITARVDDAVDTVAVLQPAITTTVAAVSTAATALGWPAWIILILNVISSSVAAIVASKKTTVEEVKS